MEEIVVNVGAQTEDGINLLIGTDGARPGSGQQHFCAQVLVQVRDCW